jgi:hypothetical protein
MLPPGQRDGGLAYPDPARLREWEYTGSPLARSSHDVLSSLHSGPR